MRASCAAPTPGFDTPQFSSPSPASCTACAGGVAERLGDDAVRTGCRLLSFAEAEAASSRAFERREAWDTFEARVTCWWALTASTPPLRAAFIDEGPPV